MISILRVASLIRCTLAPINISCDAGLPRGEGGRTFLGDFYLSALLSDLTQKLKAQQAGCHGDRGDRRDSSHPGNTYRARLSLRSQGRPHKPDPGSGRVCGNGMGGRSL